MSWVSSFVFICGNNFSFCRIVLEIRQCLVVTLSKVTKLGHPLAGLPLPLLNNLVMAMRSLEHTLVQHPSTMCLSKLMQVILPIQLVDILPIGTSPLQLPSSLPMIIIINSLSNSRILVVLHLQLMGLLTITVNHLLLVITNRDRDILRMAMVHINSHHNQGMLSQHHMISSKAMARPQAMVQLKRAKLPPTMDHKGMQPKFHLSNLPNKVMVAANSLAQMLLTIHRKGLLSQVMGYHQPPAAYGSQPQTQSGYGPPQTQKPSGTPPAYGQSQSPNAAGGYGQPGYPPSQPPPSGYSQPEAGSQRAPPSGYGSAVQPGYGPPSYGAPAGGQSGYSQAPPSYSSGYGAGYPQAPAYSADGNASGNARGGSYDGAPAQGAQQASVAKSPQS